MKDNLPGQASDAQIPTLALGLAKRFPHLLNAPFLQDLTDATKHSFLDQCTLQSHQTAHVILSQGDRAPGMFIIAQGAVEVTCQNPDGQSILVHIARRGEILGDVETLADGPCSATCIALPGTVTLLCPGQVLREQVKSDPFLRNIAKVFSERLDRDNTSKFIDQFYPVERRLCAYLYRLSVDSSEITKTQSELAGFLGCARQTLNRELGRLRDAGVITSAKGKITIADRDALLSRAAGEVALPAKP